MAVVTLGTTKQPLPGFTGRVAAPKEHGEMGYNYELAAAMPPVSTGTCGSLLLCPTGHTASMLLCPTGMHQLQHSLWTVSALLTGPQSSVCGGSCVVQSLRGVLCML
jgi:hypothetical protein